MPYIAGANTGSKQDFEIPSEGRHDAILAAFRPTGVQTKRDFKTGEPKDYVAVALVFEIKAADSHGRQFQCITQETESFFGSARLKKYAQAILDRPITDDEVENGVDMDSMLGKQCQVRIIHNNGKAYINEVLPEGKGGVKVEHDYAVDTPGLIAYFLKKAEPNTVPDHIGFVRADGTIYSGPASMAGEAGSEEPEDNQSDEGAPF